MNWISMWIQGIIVAVMISTIIEMILPEGNSKKYVKVVIGVYILFSIISPVITKVTGSNLKLSNVFQLDEYLQASANTSYENLDQKQEEQINNIYQSNLKKDMKQKLELKGYELLEVTIQANNSNPYKIEKITLKVKRKEENEVKDEYNKDVPVVNEVKIEVGKSSLNTIKQTPKDIEETLSNTQREMLKQYLSSSYEIEEKNININ